MLSIIRPQQKPKRTSHGEDESLEALHEQHWDLLYDHDLGDFSGFKGRELTGYDVACWLEKNHQFLPDRFEIVTSNPAGRRKIELALQRCRRCIRSRSQGATVITLSGRVGGLLFSPWLNRKNLTSR